MKEETNSKGKKLPPIKLNTKGCCFLCLQIVYFKAEGENETIKEQAASLRCVRRHLKIELPITSTTAQLSLDNPEISPKKPEEIAADLCESCGEIVRQFSRSFLSFEKFQMEVNYWLKRIHQQISGSKKPDLVQNYSKRMTSDPKTLTQLVFVDKLRKEINKKSLDTGIKTETKVRLHRVEIPNNNFVSPSSSDFDFEAEASNDSFSSLKQDDIESVDVKPTFKKSSILPAPSTEDSAVESKPIIPNIPSGTVKTKMFVKNKRTGRFDCFICKKNFTVLQSARLHYEAQHLRKTYECAKCGGSYSWWHNLKKHKKICNGTPTSLRAKRGSRCVFNQQTRTYNCVNCRKEFSKRWAVWDHYQSVHLNRTYKCDICGYHYTSKLWMQRHKKNCNGTVRPFQAKPRTLSFFNSNTGMYKCSICKQEFPSYSNTRAHYLEVHSKKFKCEQCSAVFKHRFTFVKHQNTCKDVMQKRLEKQRAQEKDPKYRFSCDVCDKRYTTKQAQQRHHMLVHLNQYLKCNLCSEEFRSLSALAEHKNTSHLGKRLSCRYCKKELKGRSLKSHEGKCASRYANIIKSETKNADGLS